MELVGLVIEKVKSFPAWLLKRHFKSLAELQVFRSRNWSWSCFVACRCPSGFGPPQIWTCCVSRNWMNQTSTTQQCLIKHGGLNSTTGAHGMRAHNSNKTADHHVRQLATLALCFSSHVTKPDLSELLDGAYLHWLAALLSGILEKSPLGQPLPCHRLSLEVGVTIHPRFHVGLCSCTQYCIQPC